MRWSALLVALSLPATAQERSVLEPPFTIWDVQLGADVSVLPEIDVNEIACGTGGGPMGTPLESFEDFAECPAEASGLHEVHFSYDDEMAYVARALELEYDVLRAGTSVFSHDVLLSVLIDEAGGVQGLRIMTDPRVPQGERRRAVTLMRNFVARFNGWNLDCRQLPLAEGEMMVGNGYTKEVCTGVDPAGDVAIRLDSRYFRKRGQVAINPDSQEVNSTYFESFTRLEMVRSPYEPSPPPVLE